MCVRFVVSCVTLLMCPLSAMADPAGDFFEAQVRPLLIDNCFECHTNARKGGLRLDSRTAILTGGKSGPAMVIGDPSKSLLFQAVNRTHARLRMPPGAKLAPRKIAALQTWIKNGAVWPETPEEFFRDEVRPLIKKHCLSCHADKPKGKFRLDTRASLLAGGKSGRAIQVGEPSQSLFIQAIRRTGKLKMPPKQALSKAEISTLEKWVRMGAVWSGGAIVEGDEYSITPEQKAHWAYQPVDVNEPPTFSASIQRLANSKRASAKMLRSIKSWKNNPVDRLLLDKMSRNEVLPGEAATAEAFIRRATFDLTGLPATVAEVQQFVAKYNAQQEQAVLQLIDRLLRSRHYGERWGRHWLDVVRYADTAGDAADFPIPEAYKYRNYVIDSFNADKPYDQFVREQIAGDLLPFESDEERWQQTIGTGYLAISRRIGVSPQGLKHITLEDTIDNLGKTFLGLTIGCARCHDHKFDAIPTSDYYALYGIFDSSIYPHVGAEHKPWRQDFVYRIGKQESDALLKDLRAKLEVWNRLERVKLEEYRDFQRKKITDPNRSRAQAWQAVLDTREARRPLAESFPNLEIAYAIQEGSPHDVHIQRGGSPRSQGPLVQRGFLQILGGQKLNEQAGSGRLELAQWITDPKNPLTARVMVNRIWQHHFGVGLVKTASDFGVRGVQPTHPKLLDFLADQLMSEGWSIKNIHRLIMTSQAYRLASRVSERSARALEIDPDNNLYWRANRRRIDAEQLRDSVLLLSGQLDLEPGGRHPFGHRLTYFYRQHEPFVGNFPTKKRSVYMMQQRIKKNEYLDLFDGPDGNLTLPTRNATTTTLQALYFMNSKFMHNQSREIAKRMLANWKTDGERLGWFYWAAFGTSVSPVDQDKLLEFVSRLKDKYSKQAPADAIQESWASLIRGMLASNHFMFIE